MRIFLTIFMLTAYVFLWGKGVGNQDETINENWVNDSEKAISAGFIEYFSLIKDPKTVRKTNHSLLEVIFTTICAYICGAKDHQFLYVKRESTVCTKILITQEV